MFVCFPKGLKAIVAKERNRLVGKWLVRYLAVDFKRLFTDKKVIFAALFLLIIAVYDPFGMVLHFRNYPDSKQTIGTNPFQWWMLLNSGGLGFRLYANLFWVIVVLFTGLIYHQDKNTSMYMYQITRGNQRAYLLSKFVSTGLMSFFIVLVTLEINVLMTYTLFPDTTIKTEQYYFNVPKEGSFSYDAYSVDPMMAVQLYTFINALAISIFVVFSVGISMLLNFKNRYIALIVPVIILYAITYLIHANHLTVYDIRIILQPLAAAGIEGIDWGVVFSVFGGWILVDLLLMGAALYKLRECYE